MNITDRAYLILDGRYNNIVGFFRTSREARKAAWEEIQNSDLNYVKSFVDFRVKRFPDYDIYASDGPTWMEIVNTNLITE